MDICLAGQADLPQLARLVWWHAPTEQQAKQSVESFLVDLETWWTEHVSSHFAFVARLSETQIVGVAWLALLPRVPRPGAVSRHSADLQSVFVVPDHRGQGIGSALVKAASEHALRLGAERITVHSSRRAAPLYERLGYASSRQLMQRPTGRDGAS